jgi:predicted P-loop ATPase/GTPase
VFVESFNDAIAPYGALLESVDAVVIVAPGKAYVYRDAGKVCEVAQRVFESFGWFGFRASYVFNSLKPDLSMETGLAATPSARKPHREFVRGILDTM